jgi:hypothetical protein
MHITATAVSLNADDVTASSAFLVEHFGFHEEMAADGFASLARDDAGMNVVLLRSVLPTLPDDQRDNHATGRDPRLRRRRPRGRARTPRGRGSRHHHAAA